MAIRILAVGDSTFSFFREAEAEYLKRLKRYAPVRYEVIKGARTGKNPKPGQVAAMENKAILSRLKPTDTVILLDEKGKQYSSEEFALQLEKWLAGNAEVVFVIGGAYGFSEELYTKSHALLSLSRLTFSHQMVRSFFLEQLYRGFTILNKEPYHNS